MIADRVVEFFLWGIIFAVPFSKSLVEICFTCALLFWLPKKVIRCKPHGLPIKAFKSYKQAANLPVWIFVFTGMLSTITSSAPALSLNGFFSKLLEWVMIYFMVSEIIDNKTKLNKMLAVMALSAMLIGADGLFQYLTGTDFIRQYSIGPPRMVQGPFLNKNSFAGWLLIIIPFTLSLAYCGGNGCLDLSKRPRWFSIALKAALWLLAGSLALCLVLTYSKSALVILLFILIFFGIFIDKRLLIIIIAGLLVLAFLFPNVVKERAISIVRVQKVEDIRFKFWQEALEIIEDFPLTGCGLNTYAVVGPHYRISGGGGCYPHNSYLQMAAETGLLGLGAFLWVIFGLFKTALINFRKVKKSPYGTLLIGLLAGTGGFLAHSFVDVNIYSLQLGNLLWFIMGLVVAVQNTALKEAAA